MSLSLTMDLKSGEVLATNMRFASALICAGCLLVLVPAGLAQSPVTLRIDAQAPGTTIPRDFIGLSFETESLRFNSTRVRGRLFDSTNAQLVTLFKNLGIRNLRIGGSSVDANASGYFPADADIDALFRFAKAAGVKVVYSLQLLNGDPERDAIAAGYVWKHDRALLSCFAIGNEPNLYGSRDPEITNEASFYGKWKRFAAAAANAVPEAKFGGPDTGTHGTDWAAYFAEHEAGSERAACIFSHYYVGGTSTRKTARRLNEEMLSRTWDETKYPAYYKEIGAMALSNGFPFRLTELNSYVARYPGVWGGNNSFATALFALDCMHWWAAHGCAGVNFHTVMGKYNGTVYRDPDGDYQIYPIGYGIKAFDIGGHGQAIPVAITNPNQLNLTAYAVTATNALYVTVINKEHGAGAQDAGVTVIPTRFAAGEAEAMFLTAANGEIAATNGITLGGAPIGDDAPWRGQWRAVSMTGGHCEIAVPAVCAAIIKITAAK